MSWAENLALWAASAGDNGWMKNLSRSGKSVSLAWSALSVPAAGERTHSLVNRHSQKSYIELVAMQSCNYTTTHFTQPTHQMRLSETKWWHIRHRNIKLSVLNSNSKSQCQNKQNRYEKKSFNHKLWRVAPKATAHGHFQTPQDHGSKFRPQITRNEKEDCAKALMTNTNKCIKTSLKMQAMALTEAAG